MTMKNCTVVFAFKKRKFSEEHAKHLSFAVILLYWYLLFLIANNYNRMPINKQYIKQTNFFSSTSADFGCRAESAKSIIVGVSCRRHNWNKKTCNVCVVNCYLVRRHTTSPHTFVYVRFTLRHLICDVIKTSVKSRDRTWLCFYSQAKYLSNLKLYDRHKSVISLYVEFLLISTLIW